LECDKLIGESNKQEDCKGKVAKNKCKKVRSTNSKKAIKSPNSHNYSITQKTTKT
jgi:hypothetical protein